MTDERPALDSAGTTTAAATETAQAATTTQAAANAAPVAAGKATEGTQAATGTAAAPTTEAAPAASAEDWRAKYVGKDKKRLATLERYTDEEAYLTSTFNLRKENEELRGKIKQAKPGADAKPEEIAAWRKAAGVPAEPAGYVDGIKLPDGRILGDNDKPVAMRLAEAMHGKDLPQQTYNDLVAWYYDDLERLRNDAFQKVDTFLDDGRTALEDDWGGDFGRYMGAIEGYLDSAPEGVKLAILNGYNKDGMPIGKLNEQGRLVSGDPVVLRWLAQQAMDAGHAGGKPGFGAGYDGGKSGDNRISEIEALMRGPDASEKYWKRPDVQTEYRELLERRNRMQARAA